MFNESKGLLRFAQPFDILRIREIENGFEQLGDLMAEADDVSREMARILRVVMYGQADSCGNLK